jgi:hypothetical protein
MNSLSFRWTWGPKVSSAPLRLTCYLYHLMSWSLGAPYNLILTGLLSVATNESSRGNECPGDGGAG